jgi:hypothetical protein
MGNQHLPPVIQQILDSALTPRYVQQSDIERRIDAFRPDFSEAEDLLHAIEASLRARYDHALLDDLAHYLTYARKALERAELAQTEPYINSADYHNDDPDRE